MKNIKDLARLMSLALILALINLLAGFFPFNEMIKIKETYTKPLSELFSGFLPFLITAIVYIGIIFLFSFFSGRKLEKKVIKSYAVLYGVGLLILLVQLIFKIGILGEITIFIYRYPMIFFDLIFVKIFGANIFTKLLLLPFYTVIPFFIAKIGYKVGMKYYDESKAQPLTNQQIQKAYEFLKEDADSAMDDYSNFN